MKVHPFCLFELGNKLFCKRVQNDVGPTSSSSEEMETNLYQIRNKIEVGRIFGNEHQQKVGRSWNLFESTRTYQNLFH